MLTKISSVFPVTRKTGINLEKRVNYSSSFFLTVTRFARIRLRTISFYFAQVAKIKSDEREDLKVLATGVGAALAARKVICEKLLFLFCY